MKRVLLMFAIVGMAGCDRSPASLGITGPGPPPAPPVPDDTSPVGVPSAPGSYGPSIGPMPSNGRYFNYN
jgi:hypothetical protein